MRIRRKQTVSPSLLTLLLLEKILPVHTTTVVSLLHLAFSFLSLFIFLPTPSLAHILPSPLIIKVRRESMLFGCVCFVVYGSPFFSFFQFISGQPVM
jgi:hypothetical protein